MCPDTESKNKVFPPHGVTFLMGKRIRKWSNVLIRGGYKESKAQSRGHRRQLRGSSQDGREGASSLERLAREQAEGSAAQGWGAPAPTPSHSPLQPPSLSEHPAVPAAGHPDPALPTLPATCQQHPQGSKGLTPVGPPWALPDRPLSRPSAPTAAEPSCPCSASPAALSLTQGDSGLEEPEAPSSPHGLI